MHRRTATRVKGGRVQKKNNWAHDRGFPTMVTDWRMTNLFASRFWPKRGFRETFLRLYRSIP